MRMVSTAPRSSLICTPAVWTFDESTLENSRGPTSPAMSPMMTRTTSISSSVKPAAARRCATVRLIDSKLHIRQRRESQHDAHDDGRDDTTQGHDRRRLDQRDEALAQAPVLLQRVGGDVPHHRAELAGALARSEERRVGK